MDISSKFEVWVQQFDEAYKSGAVHIMLKIASEIRENIEVVHTSEYYERFLKSFLNTFIKILKEGKPVFQSDSNEQKLRNLCLEILNRLPNTDVLKQYVKNLLELVLDLLKVENEENALICLRIIIDLHKNYRGALENYVQPFLDFVLHIYADLSNTVAKMFSDVSSSTETSSATAACTFLLLTAWNTDIILNFCCELC